MATLNTIFLKIGHLCSTRSGPEEEGGPWVRVCAGERPWSPSCCGLNISSNEQAKQNPNPLPPRTQTYRPFHRGWGAARITCKTLLNILLRTLWVTLGLCKRQAYGVFTCMQFGSTQIGATVDNDVCVECLAAEMLSVIVQRYRT